MLQVVYTIESSAADTPTWRNGRRDRLRIYCRKVWRFESSRRHHDVAGSGARGLAGRRLLCKEKIVGSNPTGSTFHTGVNNGGCVEQSKLTCGRSSVVERLLAKEKVVSSNLIARSERVGHTADPFDENHC